MRKLETPERFHILAERDQDGYWVLSEDHISLTYGDGVTLPAALRDMADVIAEYCAAVRECAAQGNAGDKAQWERVRVWVERKDKRMTSLLRDHPEIAARQAQVSRLDFTERGTPEERAAHEREVMDSMAETRKWSNAVGLAATRLAPVHPGEVLLKEFLEPAGMSHGALARALKVHPNRVSALCQGRARVTTEMALRLARFWGTSARFWLDMQTCYDLETARDKVGAQVDAEVTPGLGAETGEWKEELPFTDWE